MIRQKISHHSQNFKLPNIATKHKYLSNSSSPFSFLLLHPCSDDTEDGLDFTFQYDNMLHSFRLFRPFILW